jgi:hypothetical protein
MPDDAKVLAEFKRNAEDMLRVSLSTFKGRTYIDVRLFYASEGGELRPTKKGVTVTPDLWDAFRAAVAAAEAELQARGLWHPEGAA